MTIVLILSDIFPESNKHYHDGNLSLASNILPGQYRYRKGPPISHYQPIPTHSSPPQHLYNRNYFSSTRRLSYQYPRKMMQWKMNLNQKVVRQERMRSRIMISSRCGNLNMPISLFREWKIYKNKGIPTITECLLQRRRHIMMPCMRLITIFNMRF